jgi:hypothetical protein
LTAPLPVGYPQFFHPIYRGARGDAQACGRSVGAADISSDFGEHPAVVWIYGLSILDRSERSWQNVESILESQFPELKDSVESVVFSKNHPYWERLRQDLVQTQKDRGLNLSIHV